MSNNKSLFMIIIDYVIFVGVMLAVFHLTFNTAGKCLSDWLAAILSTLTTILDNKLINANINPAFHALVIEGICPGVGSVLAFIPTIAILFFLLAILEETGYLMKVATLMDKPLSKLGLSGQCIIPLIMGFGCSVPAIMSTASLPCQEHKRLTIGLVPFMSCSAKLPIYAMFIATFFPDHRILALLSIYATGVIIAIILALIFKATHSGSKIACPLHIPQYRLPDMYSVLGTVWQNVRGFIKKAFTVIFTASVLIWFLQSYDCNLHPVSQISDSILVMLGKYTAGFFAPLGFDDWQAASAIIAGLFAKEAVVSTLAVAASACGNYSLFSMLAGMFSPLSAFSFVVFCLLYMPCVATLSAVHNITGNWRSSIFMAVFHIFIAWFSSFLIYNIGTFISALV